MKTNWINKVPEVQWTCMLETGGPVFQVLWTCLPILVGGFLSYDH